MYLILATNFSHGSYLSNKLKLIIIQNIIISETLFNKVRLVQSLIFVIITNGSMHGSQLKTFSSVLVI